MFLSPRDQRYSASGAKMITPRRLLLCVCLLLFSFFSLNAQISGGLKGRVIDASGAALSGARVDLTQSSTNVTQTTLSTSEGYYTFSQLTPGAYQLDVIASGFQHLTRKGVTVVTCHIGAQTAEAQKRESIELAEKIISETKQRSLVPGATTVS